MIQVPPPDERNEFEGERDGSQQASAALMIAADLVRTGGLDQPAVYRDLDFCAAAVGSE